MLRFKLIAPDLENKILDGVGLVSAGAAALSNDPVMGVTYGIIGLFASIGGAYFSDSFDNLVERLVRIKQEKGEEYLKRVIDKTHPSTSIWRYVEKNTVMGDLRKAYLLYYVEKRVSDGNSAVSTPQSIWQRIKNIFGELYEDEQSHCNARHALALAGMSAGVASTNLRN